ncbi:MAG: arsenical-resistance protein, partial [Enterococcus aquimarinus]
MEQDKAKGLGIFEKYLTLWVALCMIFGVMIGKYIPIIPTTLGKFEYYQVSVPTAILIWLMIYP